MNIEQYGLQFVMLCLYMGLGAFVLKILVFPSCMEMAQMYRRMKIMNGHESTDDENGELNDGKT